jgi:hypothetical protein
MIEAIKNKLTARQQAKLELAEDARVKNVSKFKELEGRLASSLKITRNIEREIEDLETEQSAD